MTGISNKDRIGTGIVDGRPYSANGREKFSSWKVLRDSKAPKQAMNELKLKKVHRAINFSQKAWWTHTLTWRRNWGQKQKIILIKIFLSWWTVQVLERPERM